MPNIPGYPGFNISVSGAPDDAQYILKLADSDLPNAWVLTAGNNVSIDTSTPGTLIVNAAATGGGAPTTCSYVTIGAEASLSAERRLAEGTFITILDGGANGTVTLSVSSTLINYGFLTTSAAAGLPNSRTIAVAGGLTIQDTGSTILISASGVSGGGGSQNLFETISVAGFGDIVADSTTDTLTVVGTNGINVGTTPGTDTLTISGSGLPQVAFTTYAVSGQSDIVADGIADTFTFASGTGISLTTNAGSDTLTITNSSPNVDQNLFSTIAAGPNTWANITASSPTTTLTASGVDGIYVGTSGNTLVISGSGVTSAGPSFGTVQVSGQSDVVADQANDALTFVAGTGISLTTSAGGDSVTITNSSPNTTQNVFDRVAVSGQNTVIADSTTDTLTLAAGTGITITTDDSTDTITITNASPDGNTFRTISVPFNADIVADSVSDTLTIVASGINLITDASTDTLTMVNLASSFNRIVVSGQSDVVADNLFDTLTLVAGTNVTITTDPSTDAITITAATAGTGAPEDAQYLVLSGHGSLTGERIFTTGWGLDKTDAGANAAYTVFSTASSFQKIAVAGQDYIEADAVNDILNIAAGTGILLTSATSTDTLTITNSAQNFGTVAVSGQSDIVADSLSDTLTFVNGTGITITTNAGTDAVTITNSAPMTETFKTISTSGWPDIVADTTTDTLTVTGTDGIAVGTVAGTDTLVLSGSALNIFKTIAVSGQSDIVADSYTDTLTVAAGAGISLTTNAGTDTLTIACTVADTDDQNLFETIAPNTGWSSLTASSPTTTLTASGVDGIVVGSTGASTLVFSGSGLNIFKTIQVSGQSDVVADSYQDNLTFAAGTGIAITTNASTDTITITNSSPNASQNLFETIAVAGQNNIVADSATDTLTFAAGTGISITTNDSTDTVTITNSSPNADQNLFSTIAPNTGWSSFSASSPTTTLTASGVDGIFTASTGASTLVVSGSGLNIFKTIAVSGQSDVVADSYQDTLTLAAGTGISLTTNAGTDTVTITNSSPNADQNLFSTVAVGPNVWPSITASTPTTTITASGVDGIYIGTSGNTLVISGSGVTGGGNSFGTVAVSGQSDVVADQANDTLTFVAGTGVSLTTNAGGDSVTITNSAPDGNTFRTVAVSGQSDVVADAVDDTLTFANGTGIAITTNAGTDTLTVTNTAPMTNAFSTVTANTGWSSIAAGSTTATLGASGVDGIVVGTAGGNTLVVSGSGLNIFKTIAISGQSDVVADSYQDTLTLTAGTGISLTTNAGTDTITITNSSPDGNTFRTIAVSGQSDVVADAVDDTVTFAAGTGISITTNAGTDTVTITNSAPMTEAFKTITVSGFGDIVADSSTDTLTIAGTNGVSVGTTPGTDTLTISGSGLPQTAWTTFNGNTGWSSLTAGSITSTITASGINGITVGTTGGNTLVISGSGISGGGISTNDTPVSREGLVYDGSAWRTYPTWPTVYSSTWTSHGLGVSFISQQSANIVGSGSEDSLQDSTGRYYSVTTGTTSGNAGGFWDGGAYTWSIQHDPKVFYHIKTGSAITSIRLWIGFCDSTQLGSTITGSADPAVHMAAFRYVTGTDGTAFWRTYTNDGTSTGTATATSQSIAANTSYWMCIDATDSANIKFYINGVLVNTHTTNLPSTTTEMRGMLYVTTQTSGARTLYTDPHGASIEFGN